MLIDKKLLLTNTLTKRKELFTPRTPEKVLMYVCGITPYDNAHVGHGRCYVTFDVLYRLLKFLGYQTTYVRNFTDIDDKLLNRAQQEFNDRMRYQEIAQRYMLSFSDDMQKLACLTPDKEPRATETIGAMLELIQKLITKGHAYEVNGDVYFAVRSFKDYGKLSGRNLEDLCAGARVEINEQKRDPLDFALWKGEPEGTFWKSPWGYGRPGWHIECSAMASKLLAPHIDIHGGGMDLIFPHHENEIAQSEGVYGPPFANYWIHIAFVRINQEKMSKSLNNFFTLKQIFDEFDPMVLRFYYISHNYNIPLDFSFEGLANAHKAYNKLCRILAGTSTASLTATEISQSTIATKILDFLCDDLNAAGALGVVFEHADELASQPAQAAAVRTIFSTILGLGLEPVAQKEVAITPEIQELINQRDQARAEKNWRKADELREQLRQMGFEIQDKKKN